MCSEAVLFKLDRLDGPDTQRFPSSETQSQRILGSTTINDGGAGIAGPLATRLSQDQGSPNSNVPVTRTCANSNLLRTASIAPNWPLVSFGDPI